MMLGLQENEENARYMTRNVEFLMQTLHDFDCHTTLPSTSILLPARSSWKEEKNNP